MSSKGSQDVLICLGKVDGNLKKMFLYVVRCHSSQLMDRNTTSEIALYRKNSPSIKMSL